MKRNVYFILQLSEHRPLIKDVRAGTKNRSHETSSTSWISMIYSAYFITYVKNTLLGVAATHTELSPPRSIINKNKMSNRFCTAQCVTRILWVEGSFSQWLYLLSRWHKANQNRSTQKSDSWTCKIMDKIMKVYYFHLIF